MRRIKRLAAAMVTLCILTGCGNGMELPQEPMVFSVGGEEDAEYISLIYEDRIYIPYCPYEKKYLGDCIGYVVWDRDSDEYTSYICEVKGYPAEEWVIELSDTACAEGMIFKEINAESIPEGMSSEYEWNR